MLEGLQTEIDSHPELTGASDRIIMAAFNEPGSAGIDEWVLSPTPVMISKNDLYTIYLGDASLAALLDFINGSETPNKLIKARLDAVIGESINLALPKVQELLMYLHSQGIGTTEETDRLSKKGKIKKAVAHVLTADEPDGPRLLVEEDFE